MTDPKRDPNKRYEFTYTNMVALTLKPGFLLEWSVKDFGFGQTAFWQNEKGGWVYDAETLDENFVNQAFAAWLQTVKQVG